ncbi:hypothetical protein [Bacillus sp. AK031]
MSKKSTWGITFFISLGIMLALYGMMDFQYFKYEMNNKDQLVIHDGPGNLMTVTNPDVVIDHESLEVLGHHMSAYNNWILFGILIASAFIATYRMLLSDKWSQDQRKRKKYLYWTLALNGVAIAASIIFLFLYYELLNEAYHNVLF